MKWNITPGNEQTLFDKMIRKINQILEKPDYVSIKPGTSFLDGEWVMLRDGTPCRDFEDSSEVMDYLCAMRDGVAVAKEVIEE